MPKIEYVDPELQFDILPEPYKSIDEIVRNIIDNSWNRIRDRATLPTIGRYRSIFHHTKLDQDSQNWLLQNEDILGKVTNGVSPTNSSNNSGNNTTTTTTNNNNTVSLLLTNDTIAASMAITPLTPTSLKTVIPPSLAAIPSVLSLSLTKLFTRTGTGGAMALPGEQINILGTNYGDIFMVPRESNKGIPLIKLSIFRNIYTLITKNTNSNSSDPEQGNILPLPDIHSIEDIKLSSYAIITKTDMSTGIDKDTNNPSSSPTSSTAWIDTLYFQDGIVCLPEITVAPSGDHYITPVEPVHSVSFSQDPSTGTTTTTIAGSTTTTTTTKPPLGSKPSTANNNQNKSALFEFNATGVDEPEEDEAKMARRLGLNKPKIVVLPTWSDDESNRGFLIIAGSNAIGTTAEIPGIATHTVSTINDDTLTITPILPTGVIRIFHVPSEALRQTNCTNLMRYAAYDPLSSNATQQYLDKQASNGNNNQYIPPIRWLATVTLPTGVQVCEIESSMDGRYISVLGSDAHVRVYHLHPTVISPPPLEIKKDEALIALKEAAAALLGDDNAEELDDDDYSSQDEEKKDETTITRTSSKMDEYEPKYPPLPPPIELPVLYELIPPKVDPLTSITASILGDKYRIPRKYTPGEESKTETHDTAAAVPTGGPVTASATNSRPSSTAANTKTASRPTSSSGGNANSTASPSKSGTASKPGSAKSTKNEPEAPPVVLTEPIALPVPVPVPPSIPIPLITGFHFISTRLHSPRGTDTTETEAEETNDRGSIGGSASGSRANPSVMQQNTAKNSIVTTGTNKGKSTVVSNSLSLIDKNNIAKDGTTVPPRLPPNRIGYNGVPVTTGCLVWWSVDTNAPGGNTPAALALNEVLRHIQRYMIDPFSAVSLPMGSNIYASSGKGTKAVTYSVLPLPKYSYCYTPVPFHPTVSSISINPLTYQHSMVYENEFPSFSAPLFVVGDDLGNINIFEIGNVTIPKVPSHTHLPQPIPGALIPKGILGKHTAYPNVYSMYHNHHIALSSVSVYDRESTNELSVVVRSIGISADNKWIISGSSGGQVFIYDLQSTLGPGYDRYPRPTIASYLIPSSKVTDVNGTTNISSGGTNTLKGMGLVGGNLHWLRNNQSRKEDNSEIDQVLRLPCSLHAARWDGLGEIISIRMLTDLPVAIVEAYEPVTDRRGELLSLETTATAAPRVLYVYDIPAGTLLCTVRPGGTKASMLDDPSAHPAVTSSGSSATTVHPNTITVRKLLRNSSIPNSPKLSSTIIPKSGTKAENSLLFLSQIGNGVRGKGGLWRVYPDGVFFLTNLTVLDRSSITSQSVSTIPAPPSVQLHSIGMRSLLRVGYPILGKAMEKMGISFRQNKGGGNGTGAGLHNSNDIDSVRNASRIVLQLYNVLPQEEREIIQGKSALALIMGNTSTIDNENKNYIMETKAQSLVNLILHNPSASPNLFLPPTDFTHPKASSTQRTHNNHHQQSSTQLSPKRKSEYTEAITAKGDIFRSMGRLPPAYSSSSVSSSSFKYTFIPPTMYNLDEEDEGEGEDNNGVSTQNYTVRTGNQYTYELASYYDTIRKAARDTREYRIGNRSKTMVAVLNREYLG